MPPITGYYYTGEAAQSHKWKYYNAVTAYVIRIRAVCVIHAVLITLTERRLNLMLLSKSLKLQSRSHIWMSRCIAHCFFILRSPERDISNSIPEQLFVIHLTASLETSRYISFVWGWSGTIPRSRALSRTSLGIILGRDNRAQVCVYLISPWGIYIQSAGLTYPRTRCRAAAPRNWRGRYSSLQSYTLEWPTLQITETAKPAPSPVASLYLCLRVYPPRSGSPPLADERRASPPSFLLRSLGIASIVIEIIHVRGDSSN